MIQTKENNRKENGEISNLDWVRRRAASLWFGAGVPGDVVTLAIVDYLNALHNTNTEAIFQQNDSVSISSGIHEELEEFASMRRGKINYAPSLQETKEIFMGYMSDERAIGLRSLGFSAIPSAVTQTVMHGLDSML